MVAGDMSWRVTTELVWKLRRGVHITEINKAVSVMHQRLHEQDCVSDVFVDFDDEHVLLTALVEVADRSDDPFAAKAEPREVGRCRPTDLRPQVLHGEIAEAP
jgi:hypothetical protein